MTTRDQGGWHQRPYRLGYFVYPLATETDYQITSTPGMNETLDAPGRSAISAVAPVPEQRPVHRTRTR